MNKKIRYKFLKKITGFDGVVIQKGDICEYLSERIYRHNDGIGSTSVFTTWKNKKHKEVLNLVDVLNKDVVSI